MKIIKCIIFSLLIITASSAKSEELSYAAKNFRSNIQLFLREEGFAPTIDNDGSLCFKKEGTGFWIDIVGDKPFYVSMHRESIGCKDANSTYVLKAINEVNTNIRAIKCCYHGEYVSLGIETYCYVAEDFKYVFYTYLNILEVSNEAVNEEYAKYETSSNNRNNNRIGSSGYSSTTGTNSGNKIYVNGPISESSHHKWWATEVDLNSYNTIVHMIVVPKTTNTYVCSTKDEYIEDCDTGKKYYIQSSSIGLDPNRTTLYSKGSKSFTNTFPALPSNVKRINIWSGNDYYVKNLQIR